MKKNLNDFKKYHSISYEYNNRKIKINFFDGRASFRGKYVLINTLVTVGLRKFGMDELVFTMKYDNKEELMEKASECLLVLQTIVGRCLRENIGGEISERDYILLCDPSEQKLFLGKYYGVIFHRRITEAEFFLSEESTNPLLYVIGFTEKEYNIILRNSSTYRLKLILGDIYGIFPCPYLFDEDEEMLAKRRERMEDIALSLNDKLYNKNSTGKDLYFRNSMRLELPHSSILRLSADKTRLTFELSCANLEALGVSARRLIAHNRRNREKVSGFLIYVTGISHLTDQCFVLDSADTVHIINKESANQESCYGGVFLHVINKDPFFSKGGGAGKKQVFKERFDLGTKYDGYELQIHDNSLWEEILQFFSSEDLDNPVLSFSKIVKIGDMVDVESKSIGKDQKMVDEEEDGEEDEEETTLGLEIIYRRTQLVTVEVIENSKETEIRAMHRCYIPWKERETRDEDEISIYSYPTSNFLKHDIKDQEKLRELVIDEYLDFLDGWIKKKKETSKKIEEKREIVADFFETLDEVIVVESQTLETEIVPPNFERSCKVDKVAEMLSQNLGFWGILVVHVGYCKTGDAVFEVFMHEEEAERKKRKKKAEKKKKKKKKKKRKDKSWREDFSEDLIGHIQNVLGEFEFPSPSPDSSFFLFFPISN